MREHKSYIQKMGAPIGGFTIQCYFTNTSSLEEQNEEPTLPKHILLAYSGI